MNPGPFRSAEGNCEKHGSPDTGDALSGGARVGFRGMSFVKDCPVCGVRNTISASRIGMGPRVRCECGFQILLNLDKLDVPENQKVVYGRTRDFFSYHGRLPVGEFWISAAAACLFPGLLLAAVYSSTYPAPPSPPFVNFSIALLAVFLHPISVKRGHDLGLSWVFGSLPLISVALGNLSGLVPEDEWRGSVIASILTNLLYLISLVSLATTLALAFLPGRRRVNRYGPHPRMVRFDW
jgi:uncharacterized membrane protein YhaH (DUF805 family)